MRLTLSFRKLCSFRRWFIPGDSYQKGVKEIIQKRKKPLIHLIHNYVTLKDVVNMILAAGGSAICGEAPEEVQELTALSDALLINPGMPTKEKLRSMLLSGQRANELGIPIILDPVGAGASSFRNDILRELLVNLKFACIRGNRSEIAFLCGHSFSSGGTEESDTLVSKEEIRQLARHTGSLVLATGKEDVLTDGDHLFEYAGASPLLKEFTGGGCMLSGVLAVFLTGTSLSGLPTIERASAALQLYRKSAETAVRNLRSCHQGGSLSFKNALIDTVSLSRNEVATFFKQ